MAGAAALFALTSTNALAASVFWLPDLKAAALDGAIHAGDLGLLEQMAQAHPDIRGLYLNSPGGDFIEAMDIGQWVHQRALPTYASTLCMSGLRLYLARRS